MNESMRRIFASGNFLPCPLCRTGDGNGCNAFCPDCLKKMHRVAEPRCRGCGGELDGALALCRKCLAEKPRPFLDAVSLFDYRGETREMIRLFKNGRCELARPCGTELAKVIAGCGWPIDLVTAVPLHWTRRFARSYNQSQFLAEIVAGELKLPYADCLRRVRRGKKQKTLDSAERHRNMKGAFQALSAARGRVILLLDDVFTTGATLSAASKSLLDGGAQAVFCATVCRA